MTHVCEPEPKATLVKIVSKTQLRDGVVVQVKTSKAREQAVRTVVRVWGGQLAAIGMDPARLQRLARGEERYEYKIGTQGHALMWLRVHPPVEHEPDRITVVDMGLEDLRLHGGIGGENLTPLRLASQQINKAAKRLEPIETDVQLPKA